LVASKLDHISISSIFWYIIELFAIPNRFTTPRVEHPRPS
jgi:hypothetical protein